MLRVVDERLSFSLSSTEAQRRGAMAALQGFLAAGSVFVLTGAGVSTDSGIPDYRDETGAWKAREPIQYRDFVGSEAVRKRYWARSLLGFPLMDRAQPNAAHRALAELEARGVLSLLVTQNVDGLHHRAGSHGIVNLHGRLDQVRCLDCGAITERAALQAELVARNPTTRTQALSSDRTAMQNLTLSITGTSTFRGAARAAVF